MIAQIGSVKITPAKVQQIREAGRRQLSPEEFNELSSLLFDLGIYGLNPWINVRLGTLMSKIEWQLELEPSPEWSEALQACDFAFLGEELRDMCRNNFVSPVGHKKELCARLYNAGIPEVVAVMEPYLKKEVEIQEPPQVIRLPQTEHLHVEKVRKVKDRLEEIYRMAPDEFYRRKKLVEQAIKEREKGQARTMPELTLEELRDVLKFTELLYR